MALPWLIGCGWRLSSGKTGLRRISARAHTCLLSIAGFRADRFFETVPAQAQKTRFASTARIYIANVPEQDTAKKNLHGEKSDRIHMLAIPFRYLTAQSRIAFLARIPTIVQILCPGEEYRQALL